MDLEQKTEKRGINIIWVVTVVILTSLSLVTLSFMIFLNSGAYDTVKVISDASKALAEDDLDGYDTKSPIQAKDIDLYYQSLKSRLNAIERTGDYNYDSINEQSLGY
jgi:hypothetical protein